MELEDPSSGGSSLFQLIIALIMIGIGHSYSDECNNGATDYLITGGWLTIAFNILPGILFCVKSCALMDGVISSSENCVINSLSCIKNCLPLISFVVTLWVKNGTNKKMYVNFFIKQFCRVAASFKNYFSALWSHV